APAWLEQSVEAPKRRRRAPAAAAASAVANSRSRTLPMPGSTASAVSDAHAELQEYLREWRRTTAREQGIAAFIIMHDTSLAELCRVKPNSLSELRRVPGFGERKTELYGREILEALGRFRNGARATETAGQASDPAGETLRLLEEGRTLEEIAQIR